MNTPGREWPAPRQLALPAVILAGIAALGLAIFFLHGGPAARVQPITVAVQPLEQNALLYVAEARQLFESHGLAVTIQEYDTGVATINALLEGKAEIAGLTEFPFLKPTLEKRPLRILAITDRFESAYLLVRRDRGIAAKPDLAGKKIGLIRGTILEFYLGRSLQLLGLDLRDVTILDTESTSRTTAAIVSGEIDAAVTYQPHVDEIQARLGSEVTTWPVQNDQLAYGILASDADWLDRNPETVESLLRALADAEAYLLAHPQEARIIVQNRLNLDSQYLAGTWPLHQFCLSLDLSLIMAMNDEARWMIENGLTTETAIPDLKGFVYLEGLEAVKPEAVDIVR
jgi:NitT/TauT family transport system substrate-binding protein